MLPELVARESKYDESLGRVLAVEFLELFVVGWCQASVRGHIDDEERLALATAVLFAEGHGLCSRIRRGFA